MKVIHELKLDLLRCGIAPRISAVQWDGCSRILAIQLLCGSQIWSIPDNIRVLIRYRKNDRTGGVYDTLPDGTAAWYIQDSKLMVILAPQVLTCPGETALSVTLVQEDKQLSTFPLTIDVQRQPDSDTISENYRYVSAFLPQPSGGATVGQFLKVSQVDRHGHVLALETAAPDLTQIDRQLLLQLLRNATYGEDVSALLSALDSRWNGGEAAAVPIGLRVIYSGESLPVGTALDQLYPLLTVYLHFSDGTRRQLANSEFSLAGNAIILGDNIITVRYGDLYVNFHVIGAPPTYYTVTNQMTNATTNNTLNIAKANGYYTARITANSGYCLVYLQVTMGEADVTNDVFADGIITIAAVTGDIKITAVAVEAATAQTLLADANGALLKSLDGYNLAVSQI